MKSFEPSRHVNQSFPYLTLGEKGLVPKMVPCFLEQVSILCNLDHDAECLGMIIEESLFVADDVGMVYGC